jgi:hypothetical protein
LRRVAAGDDEPAEKEPIGQERRTHANQDRLPHRHAVSRVRTRSPEFRVPGRKEGDAHEPKLALDSDQEFAEAVALLSTQPADRLASTPRQACSGRQPMSWRQWVSARYRPSSHRVGARDPQALTSPKRARRSRGIVGPFPRGRSSTLAAIPTLQPTPLRDAQPRHAWAVCCAEMASPGRALTAGGRSRLPGRSPSQFRRHPPHTAISRFGRRGQGRRRLLRCASGEQQSTPSLPPWARRGKRGHG